jgi:hypothetical protein
MGMFKKFSTCSHDNFFNQQNQEKNFVRRKKKTFSVGNPNPNKFEILKHQTVGRFTIVRIHYPDCHNFEGQKILVFEDISISTIKKLKSIDPHFCNNKAHPSPIARFVPTDHGWRYAISFCKNA